VKGKSKEGYGAEEKERLKKVFVLKETSSQRVILCWRKGNLIEGKRKGCS
jgi:hypothetical protein